MLEERRLSSDCHICPLGGGGAAAAMPSGMSPQLANIEKEVQEIFKILS